MSLEAFARRITLTCCSSLCWHDQVLKANPMVSARLAWRYIAIRVLYTLVYLGGEGTQVAGAVRAIVWYLGISTTTSLFRLALKA
jgi:uncharacterized MAPEG superfamily protein